MAKTLREFAEGSIIKLKENGVLTDYYVAKHDYEPDLNGVGRTLLTRRYSAGTSEWAASGGEYANGTLDALLNGSIKARFDKDTQRAMGETEFYYTPRDGVYAVSTLRRSVFVLSLTELGLSHTSGGYTTNVEGTALPIASSLKVLYSEANSAVKQWVRTIRYTSSSYNICLVETSGTVSNGGASNTLDYRPALTLPSDNTYLLDDGEISHYFWPVISGEDTHIGDRDIPFTQEYSISVCRDAEIKVTELIDGVIQIRSYTAEPDVMQTATVATQGLSQGDHTLNIVAEAEGVTSTRVITFTLPVAYLSPLAEDQGEKGEKFTIPYMCKTYSGVDLSVTEKVDGEVIREYTAVSGEAQEMTVDTEFLTDTQHNAEITVTGDGETKTATTVFRVKGLAIGSGGSAQELQGYDGKPVYPATIAKAVINTDGESAEKKFAELAGALVPGVYAWKIYDVDDELVKSDATERTIASFGNSSGSQNFVCSKSVSVVDGSIIFDDPEYVTLSYADYAKADQFNGKYFAVRAYANNGAFVFSGSSTKLYYCDPDAAPATQKYSSNIYYVLKTAREISQSFAGKYTETVVSKNINAYPKNERRDGKYYAFCGSAQTDMLLGKSAQILAGSYIGTGTSGSTAPTVIPVGFDAKLVLIRQPNYASVCEIPVFSIGPTFSQYSIFPSGNGGEGHAAFDGTSLLLSADKADRQCNSAGTEYYWLAIG